ncbi:MAG: cAMP-activated global transcriptional regulator [Pseudomonadota bacterium]|jgi:CRP/FNR family cyclic AMP-dependent transcriptional regulator
MTHHLVFHRQQALDNFLSLCSIKEYPAKSTLIHSGAINTMLYYIIEGSVVVEAHNENENRKLVLAYLGQGEFIGELGVFKSNMIHPMDMTIEQTVIVNVITRCDCKLARITHERARHVLKNMIPNDAPDILLMLGEQMAERLLTTSRNFRDLAFMDAKGRIARSLLDLCQEPEAIKSEQGTQLKISRQELARIVGCSREVVGKALKCLEEEQFIATVGRRIIVLDF